MDESILLMDSHFVAGMVLLYNSKQDVLSNIKTYIHQVEKLYVIDNSDQPNLALIRQIVELSSVKYISNNGNKGVAHALNVAANLAVEDGFKYLLTMDDDSQAPPSMIEQMCIFLNQYPDRSRVGITSAVHNNFNVSEDFRSVLCTMTSGNLLNLEIYKIVGGFWEELFIDHVDHEYGLRLNKAGYQVIELPRIILKHSLGQSKLVKLFFYHKYFISHQPIRMYYITRNGWLVAKKYPVFWSYAIKLIAKEWIKSLFLENNRRKRVYLLVKGISDAQKGRMGKLMITDNI